MINNKLNSKLVYLIEHITSVSSVCKTREGSTADDKLYTLANTRMHYWAIVGILTKLARYFQNYKLITHKEYLSFPGILSQSTKCPRKA